MKIGYWKVQTDIGETLSKRGYKPAPLDWHGSDWHQQFQKDLCDGYIWYPHALHSQWYKLWDRAYFIENVIGKRCFPGSFTSYLFQDKLHQKYIFDHFNFPTPKTDILTSYQQAREYFSSTEYPVVVKDVWGYGGHGIHRLNDQEEAKEYIRKKRMPVTEDKVRKEHYIYAQQFIPAREEYRVMTVGSNIILAYKKSSDQFLKHVWRGAEVEFEVEEEVKNLVKKWNSKLNLDWCGWDLIKDEKGNLFLLELNPIFGTKVLEEQGLDLADHLVDYMEGVLEKNEL